MAKKTKPSSSGSSKAAGSRRRPSSAKVETPALAIADLGADGENPRAIDEEALAGLGESLAEFGDLGVITFNVRTQQLVSGHQRVRQLRELYGDVAMIAGERDDVAYLPAGDELVPVRLVDWSVEKQRAANLAANNPRLQGKFTDGLEAYLAQAKGELEPEIWEDTGLALLFAQSAELAAPESWTVVVDCDDEEQQRKLYDELRERGLEVKLVTV